MKKILPLLALITLLLASFISCKTTSSSITSMVIEDSIREYLPITQGDKQDILVKVKNTGDQPLKIEDVLPSCSCTDVKIMNTSIPPGKFGYIQMTFDSNKNIGYVGVYTTIKANTAQSHHTLFFEINIVPDANLHLSSKEKDKLLIHLINKDKMLMKQLHFQRLEDSEDLVQ